MSTSALFTTPVEASRADPSAVALLDDLFSAEGDPPDHAPGPPEHAPGPPEHVEGPPEHAEGDPPPFAPDESEEGEPPTPEQLPTMPEVTPYDEEADDDPQDGPQSHR